MEKEFKITRAQTRVCRALIVFCKNHKLTIQSSDVVYFGKMRMVKCNGDLCQIENPKTKYKGVIVYPIKRYTNRNKSARTRATRSH